MILRGRPCVEVLGAREQTRLLTAKLVGFSIHIDLCVCVFFFFCLTDSLKLVCVEFDSQTLLSLSVVYGQYICAAL